MEGLLSLFFIIPIFVLAFGGAIVVVVVKAIKGAKKEQQQQAKTEESYRMYSSSSSTSSGKSGGMTDEQRRRLEYLREQQKQKETRDQHERHQADAHEHGHTGEEEHYEEIVGSLGDVNDEGCADLNGVRFIAHDLAYDTTEAGKHDYKQLAQAIVMGEIINNPRFKGLKRP